METNLYIVTRRDSMGAPCFLIYQHADDEDFIRSGNAIPDDDVSIYVVAGAPRKYRVESTHLPIKLVGI